MATTPEIGRLARVPARDVWSHEALAFTPWLLENADVLADALGIDLVLEAAEHAVGAFSLDLIGHDRATGQRVIVENQLGVSDHGHLGQIMTYAGGTDANVVVWVAPFFREEHRRALEWLNERTDEESRFFAVQFEAVRIGDSPPAPLLSVVVQPNDWGKQVRATAVRQSTNRWGLDDLLASLREVDGPVVAASAERLVNHHRELGPGADLYWGTGQKPSVTATLDVSGTRVQPWSIYCYGAPGGGAVWALNFDWLHKSGSALPEEVVVEVAEQLSAVPGVEEAVAAAQSVGWRKRPSLPAALILSSPDHLSTVQHAMAGLYRHLVEQS